MKMGDNKEDAGRTELQTSPCSRYHKIQSRRQSIYGGTPYAKTDNKRDAQISD